MFDCLFRSAARQAREAAVADLYARHTVERFRKPIIRPVPRMADTAYPGNLAARKSDDGFDTTGFLLGYATGVPISPMHGISGGAMLGAVMHPSAAGASPAPSTPEIRNEPAPSAAYEPPSPSSHDTGSSYDSGSSSSGSDGGGGGSSGGSDGGGSF